MPAKKRKWAQGELSDMQPKKSEPVRTNYRNQFLEMVKGKDKEHGNTN